MTAMWPWIGFGLFTLLVGFLAFWFGNRRMRALRTTIGRRTAISDEEVVARYFPDGEMTVEVLSFVRQMFATIIGVSSDRLLPDDDLTFFFEELDMVEDFKEWEQKFEIKIDDADAVATKGTLRGIAKLIKDSRPSAFFETLEKSAFVKELEKKFTIPIDDTDLEATRLAVRRAAEVTSVDPLPTDTAGGGSRQASP